MLSQRERPSFLASAQSRVLIIAFHHPQLIIFFFNLVAVKEELPQDRPTVNQTQAEVITEQANLNTSAARSSKVLYVITTSPSHPPQTVPGSNSWASSMGAGSHRVEGSVVGDDRNRSALGCFREARWGVGSVICEGTSSH